LRRKAAACLVALGLLWGCGALRSEFFRGEIAYLLVRGDGHYRGGEYREAESCYRRAVRLDPACAKAHASLGNIAYVRGAFQEASSCYNRALGLNPALEPSIAPLLLEARRMLERGELELCGAGPARVLELLLSGREAEVEALLGARASASLAARHAAALPRKDRERLLELAAGRGRSGPVPPRCALLYGHLLAVDESNGYLAVRLLTSAVKEVRGEARRKACMALGALYARLGRESDAAWAYEAALEAGCAPAKVVPLLARLYGVPAAAIPAPP
jgi:Flp pilus assembly protein TadD